MAGPFRERCDAREMKAVWYERTGPAADVLSFGEMPTPVAGPGEVRIRLEASGVNPADTYRRGGTYRPQEFPRVRRSVIAQFSQGTDAARARQ